MPWKFHILISWNSQVIYPWNVYFSWKTGYFSTCFIISVCFQTNTLFISGTRISNSHRCYHAKPSAYYFHVKTKISVDFQIYISVPSKAVLHTVTIILWNPDKPLASAVIFWKLADAISDKKIYHLGFLGF